MLKKLDSLQNGFGLVFVSSMDEFRSSLLSDSGVVSWSTVHFDGQYGDSQNTIIPRDAQIGPTMTGVNLLGL